MLMLCHQGVWNSLQSSLSGSGDIHTMFLAKLFMYGKLVYIPSVKLKEVLFVPENVTRASTGTVVEKKMDEVSVLGELYLLKNS